MCSITGCFLELDRHVPLDIFYREQEFQFSNNNFLILFARPSSINVQITWYLASYNMFHIGLSHICLIMACSNSLQDLIEGHLTCALCPQPFWNSCQMLTFARTTTLSVDFSPNGFSLKQFFFFVLKEGLPSVRWLNNQFA